MRKTILGTVLLVVLSTQAWAGDWNVRVSFGSPFPVVRHRVHHRPLHRIPPRPRVIVQKPRGHWVWRETRVWVPGYYENVWVPPEYRDVWISACANSHGHFIRGHWERRLVRPGYHKKVWHEGYYRTERNRVWVPY